MFAKHTSAIVWIVELKIVNEQNVIEIVELKNSCSALAK